MQEKAFDGCGVLTFFFRNRQLYAKNKRK